MIMRFWPITALALLLGTSLALGEKLPWPQRVARGVEIQHAQARARVAIKMWPAEPGTPPDLDPSRFAASLDALCAGLTPARRALLAPTVLVEAASRNLDPFLLAALIVERSACLPRERLGDPGFGLARIEPALYAPLIRNGRYRYQVRDGASWSPRELDVSRYPFNRWQLARPEPAIYFAAALLAAWRDECPALDAPSGSVPHRHFVSHFYFGDTVRDAGPEERLLTVRRRLLEAYAGTPPTAIGRVDDTAVVSPLDGVPRLVLDGFGTRRGGRRGPVHRGLDLDGRLGEPVRAIAAGRVVFAGVDLPTGSQALDPAAAAAFPDREMGAGGLYVCVDHGGFKSCAMHLDTLAVADWDEVTAGQVIGTLGRSGARVSGPHLHLELRRGAERFDPAGPLAAVLVDPGRPAESDTSQSP